MNKLEFIKFIKSNIKGNVARIGGTVNQYIDYDLCKVVDFNLADGGYGQATAINRNIINRIIYKLKGVRKELLYLRYGEKIPRPFRMVIHDFHLEPPVKYQNKFDCVISSNVIEHSPNPIKLLLNLSKLLNENGWIFHAIPSAKHCYDKYRNISNVEHMIEDYKNDTDLNDQTHIKDYYNSAVLKDGYQKGFHEIYPVTYPYIHQHTFDLKNVNDLFSSIFQDVNVYLDQTEEWNDIFVIYKNKIRDEFNYDSNENY